MLHAGENWLWCDEFLFGETCPLPCPGEHRVIITIVLCMFFVYVFLVITIVLCSLSLFTLSSPLLHPMFQRTSPRVRLAEVMAEPKKENESPKGEDWWKNVHLTDFWSFWPKWGWVKNPTLRRLTDDHWSLNIKGENHNHVRIIDRKSLSQRDFRHHSHCGV